MPYLRSPMEGRAVSETKPTERCEADDHCQRPARPHRNVDTDDLERVAWVCDYHMREMFGDDWGQKEES